MFKTTFAPGPSQLSNQTRQDIHNAVYEKIIEISHRSPKFREISALTQNELRKFMKIPENYRIFYMASATDCMISTIQNCVEKSSFHFVAGNFSERFFNISETYHDKVYSDSSQAGEINNYETKIPDDVDLISLTYCETSTGITINNEIIKNIREKNPKKIITVDITSTAGSVPVNIKDADIWFFSIQKCFGLPSGLGIMIVSPEAVKKSRELSQKNKNLASINTFELMEKYIFNGYQVRHTPNILAIHLLGQKLKRWNEKNYLQTIQKETREKNEIIKQWVKNSRDFCYFIKNPKHRGDTVCVIEGTPENILEIHKKVYKHNIELGKGYGKIRNKTFRIANFPAISIKEMQNLVKILN